jgi:hypothetical protein
MHYKVWPQVLALAENHGWQPEGTTMRWQGCGVFEPDYTCSDSGKNVSETDARAMAAALERALNRLASGELREFAPPSPPVIIFDSWLLDDDDMLQANRGITVQFLGEFIAFAQCGAFRFYWPD